MNSLLANLDLTKILAVVYYHKLVMKDCYQASRKAKPCPSNMLMGNKKKEVQPRPFSEIQNMDSITTVVIFHLVQKKP
jgi:hypothetical protein